MVSDWLISSNLVEEQNQYYFLFPVYILINDHEKYDVAPEEVMCCTMVEIKSWGTASNYYSRSLVLLEGHLSFKGS